MRANASRLAIRKNARRRLIGRAAPGHHVGRDRPRRAAEAEQRDVAAAAPPSRAAPPRTPARTRSRPRSRASALSFAASSSGSSRGPSPASNVTVRPSACGTTRMSENRIAASKPKRRIGCKVTSVGQLGREAQIEEASGFRAQVAILGQIAPGLAHEPHRRRRLATASEDVEDRFGVGQRDRSSGDVGVSDVTRPARRCKP